jgi:DNA-binding transcriptional ArsR family regulator
MRPEEASRPQGIAEAAKVFAALGDPTRLSLLERLSAGGPSSITGLARGRGLTRQAIAKHLKVLEDTGLIARERHGRETRIAFRDAPVSVIRAYLADVERQWDSTLSRLKSLVEEDADQT